MAIEPHRSDSGVSVDGSTGVTVIAFPGCPLIDQDSVDAVTAALLDAVATSEPPRIALDLSNVQFLSSQGLAMLLQVRRAVDGRGGEAVLCQPRSEVVRLLRIARFDKIFHTFDSIDGAAGYLRA